MNDVGLPWLLTASPSATPLPDALFRVETAIASSSEIVREGPSVHAPSPPRSISPGCKTASISKATALNSNARLVRSHRLNRRRHNRGDRLLARLEGCRGCRVNLLPCLAHRHKLIALHSLLTARAVSDMLSDFPGQCLAMYYKRQSTQTHFWLASCGLVDPASVLVTAAPAFSANEQLTSTRGPLHSALLHRLPRDPL